MVAMNTARSFCRPSPKGCPRNRLPKLNKKPRSGPRLTEAKLQPLHPLPTAQTFQRLRNLSRPLRHLVITQRPFARLEPGSHQNRVLARANFFSAENFYRDETAQLRDAKSSNALVNLLELHAVVKHKGEVALNIREAGQRFITHLAQIVLVEPIEIDLGDKNILPQFAGCGHIGMNLAKLGDGSAIQHSASRASGMIVVSRLRIVVERPMAERRE